MTGLAVVNSPHAFQCIKNLFVENYLTPESSFKISHNIKLAWQSAAICRAAIEIIHGDKMPSKKIHTKMWEKYNAWVRVIREEPDAGLKLESKPES